MELPITGSPAVAVAVATHATSAMATGANVNLVLIVAPLVGLHRAGR
jgi:hypothetical protein